MGGYAVLSQFPCADIVSALIILRLIIVKAVSLHTLLIIGRTSARTQHHVEGKVFFKNRKAHEIKEKVFYTGYHWNW